MIKKICLFLLLCVSTISAVEYQLADFMKEDSNIDAGYVNIDSDSFFKVGLNPDFKWKMLELGLNVNLYVPLGDYDVPDDLDWVALRHLGINYKDIHGIKFGKLRNITLGQGLLVDDFSTGTSTQFVQSETGVIGFTTILDTKITAMQTVENVQAVRVERPVVAVANTPVIVGATFAQDTDGIDADDITRAEQSGYAADISYPIGGEVFTLYAEYAELTDYGSGASAGARGSLFNLISYKAEYRTLGTSFAPGYFNSTYQETSFDFSTDALSEKVSGFLVNAGTSFMGDFAKAAVQYELYDEINVLSGALGWKQIGPVTGVVNVSKPFNAQDNSAIVVADLYYRTGKFYDLIIRHKRVYETSDDYTQSTEVAFSFNTSKLLPGLPF